jgi:hypothetical protein
MQNENDLKKSEEIKPLLTFNGSIFTPLEKTSSEPVRQIPH